MKPILALFAVAGGAGAIWYLTSRTPAQPEPAPTVAPAPTPAPTAPVQRAEAPPPRSAAVVEKLRMPDGSLVDPLNGVTRPGAIVWGDAPWSPIVRKERNNGLDWYVHADGTYTTTMMQWRGDLGREDAVTLCLHPAKPAPVEPVGDAPTGGNDKPKRP